MLLEGLAKNLLITVFSSISPFLVGLFFNFMCKRFPVSIIIARIVGMIFESICPVVIISLIWYSGLGFAVNDRLICCIIGFSISFIGYIPSRYRADYSFSKNTVVNLFGLLSTIFKWSFCVSAIAIYDLLGRSDLIRGSTSDSGSLWLVLLISFFIILMLELAKFLAKKEMK